jgi:hypothetical protein
MISLPASPLATANQRTQVVNEPEENRASDVARTRQRRHQLEQFLLSGTSVSIEICIRFCEAVGEGLQERDNLVFFFIG